MKLNKFCLARANKKRCCIFEFAELSTENYREKRQGKAILFELSIFCVRKKRNIEQTKVAKWYYNVMKSIHKLLKAIFGNTRRDRKILVTRKIGKIFWRPALKRKRTRLIVSLGQDRTGGNSFERILA